MQPFQFGLETLLRIRRRLEERAKNEFIDQQRRVQEKKHLIDKLFHDREGIEAKAKAAARTTVDVAFEKSCVEYRQILHKRIEAARVQFNQLKEEATRLRDVYIQAQQAVKILEKLKERRFSEYLKDAQRQEQAFLDEVAVSHFQSAQKH